MIGNQWNQIPITFNCKTEIFANSYMSGQKKSPHNMPRSIWKSRFSSLRQVTYISTVDVNKSTLVKVLLQKKLFMKTFFAFSLCRRGPAIFRSYKILFRSHYIFPAQVSSVSLYLYITTPTFCVIIKKSPKKIML